MKTPLILSSFFLHWAIVSAGFRRDTASGRIVEQNGSLRRRNLVEDEAILDNVQRTSSTLQNGRQKSCAHEAELTRREVGSVEKKASSGTDWGGLFLREQKPKEQTSDLPPLISMLTSRHKDSVSVRKAQLHDRRRRSLGQYSNSDYAWTIDGSNDEAEVRKILANAKAQLSTGTSDSMGIFQDNSFGNDWLSFVLPTRSGSFTDMLFNSESEGYDWDTGDFDVNTNWMNSEHLSNAKDTVNYNEAIEASKKDSLGDYKSSHSKWNMGLNQEYLGQLRTETSWSSRDESRQTEAEPARKNVIAPEFRPNEAGKSGSNAIRDHNQWDEGRLIKSDEGRNGKEDYRDIKVNVKNGETLFGDSRIDNSMIVGSDKPSTGELPVKIPEAHNEARQNKQLSNNKSLFISDPLALLPKLEGVGRHGKKSEESTAHESTPRKVHEGLQDRNPVDNIVHRNTKESYLGRKSTNDESSTDNAIDDSPREIAITRDRKTSSIEKGASSQEVEDQGTLGLFKLIGELSKLREELNTGFDENNRNHLLSSSERDARQGAHEERDKYDGAAETSERLDMGEHGRENVHDEREEQEKSVNGHYVSLGDYNYPVSVGEDVKYDWSVANARQKTVTVPNLTVPNLKEEQPRVGKWRGMQDSERKVTSLESVGAKEVRSEGKAEQQEPVKEAEVSVLEVENEIENSRVNDANRHKSGSVNAVERISGIGSKGRGKYDVSDRIETKSIMEHWRGTGIELQGTNEGNRLKLKDLKGKKFDPEVAVGRFEAESLGTKDAKRNKFRSLNMERKKFEWDGLEGEKIWKENLENGKFKAGGAQGKEARSKEPGREKYDSEKLDKKKSGSMNQGKEEARLPVVEKFKPLPDYTLSNVNKSPMENEQKSEQSVSYGAQVNGGKNSIPEHDKVSTKEGNNKSREHDKEIQINYSDFGVEGNKRTELKGYEDNNYGVITISSVGDETYDDDFWNRGIIYEQEDVYAIHNNAFDTFEGSSSDSDNLKYRITSRKKSLNANGERNTYENKGEQYEKLITYGETLKDLNDKISASKYNLKERMMEAGEIRSGKDEVNELELLSIKGDAKERNINVEKGKEKLSWDPKINGSQSEDDDEEDVKSKWMFDKDTSSVEEDEALIKRRKNLQTHRSLSGLANIAGETFANAEIHGENNNARRLSAKTNITGEEPFNHAGVYKGNNKALKSNEIYKPNTREYKLNKLSKASNIARDEIPDNTASISDQVNSVNKISDPLQRYDDKKNTLSLDSAVNQRTRLSGAVGTKSLEDPEGNDESVVATAKAHVVKLRDGNKGFRWSENDTSGVESGRSAESNFGTSATVNRTADKDQFEIRGSRVNFSELSSTDVHAPEYSDRLSKNNDSSGMSHLASLNEDKGNNNEDSRHEGYSDIGKESRKASGSDSETKSDNEAENDPSNGPGKVSSEELERESGYKSGGRSGNEPPIESEVGPGIESEITSENQAKNLSKKLEKELEENLDLRGKMSEKVPRNRFNIKSETEPGGESEKVFGKGSEAEFEERPENVSANETKELPGKESIVGPVTSDEEFRDASESEPITVSNIISREGIVEKSRKESEENSNARYKIPGKGSEKKSVMESDVESARISGGKSGKGLEEESEGNTDEVSEMVSNEKSEELSETESGKGSEEESARVPEIIIGKREGNVTAKEPETESIKESRIESEEESGTASEREFKEESEEGEEGGIGIENKWLSNRVTHGAAGTLWTASGTGETGGESQMRKETHVSAEKQGGSEKQTTSDNSFETMFRTAAQTVVRLDGTKISEPETPSSKEAAKETKSTRYDMKEADNLSKLHGTDILSPESIDTSVITQQHREKINVSKGYDELDARQEKTGKGYEGSKLNLHVASLIESSIRNKEQDLAEQREGKTVANGVNTVQASDSSSTSGTKFPGNSDTSRKDNISSAAINQASKEEPEEEKITRSNAAEDHSSELNDSKVISNLSLKSSERNEAREEGNEEMASTRVEEELKSRDVKPNLSNSAELSTKENSKEPKKYYSPRLDNPDGHGTTSRSDGEQSGLEVSKVDAMSKSNNPWSTVTQKQAETTGRNGLNDPHNEEDGEEASLNGSESITRDLNKEEAFKEGSPSVEVTESNDVTAESGESSPTANTPRTTEDEVPLSDLGIESSRKSDKLLRKWQGTLDRSTESGTRSVGDEITKDNEKESDKYEAPSAARQLIESSTPGTLTATGVQTALNTEITGEAHSTNEGGNLIVPRSFEGTTVYPINWGDNEEHKEVRGETISTYEEMQVDSALYGPGHTSKSGLSESGSAKGSSKWIHMQEDEIDSSVDRGGNMKEEKRYGASNNGRWLSNASKIDSSVGNGGIPEKEGGNGASSNAGRVKPENNIYQYDDIFVKSNDAGWGMHQNEFTNYIPRTSHVTVSVDGSDYEIGSDTNAGKLGDWDPLRESNPSNVREEVDVRNEESSDRHDQKEEIDTVLTVSRPGLQEWDHNQNRKSEITPFALGRGTSLQDSYMPQKQEGDPRLDDTSGNGKKLQSSVNERNKSRTSGREPQEDDQSSKSGINILPNEQGEESNQKLATRHDELYRVSQSTENLHEMSDNEKGHLSLSEVRIEGLPQLKHDQESDSNEKQELRSKTEDKHTSSKNQLNKPTHNIDPEEENEDHDGHHAVSNHLNSVLITETKGGSSLNHHTLNDPVAFEYTSNPIKSDLHKHGDVSSDDSVSSPKEDIGERGLESRGENGGHDLVHSTEDPKSPISKLPDQDWSTFDERSQVNLGEINVVSNIPLSHSYVHGPLDEMGGSKKSNDPLSRVSKTELPGEADEGIANAKFAKKLQPSFGKFAKPQAKIWNKSGTSSPVSPRKFKSHSDEDELTRSVESSPHASSGEVLGTGNKNGDLCTVLESIFLPANERDNKALSFDESSRVPNEERTDELENTLQPSEEQVDVYIVKQALDGPVMITHVEGMTPLVVTSDVISESAYEEMVDIFERNRM